MARKYYTDEFRRRAVDLYESTAGATLKAIAVDLGISRGALREWALKLGTGAAPSRRSESPAAKIIRLEAGNARLEAERVKLETERDILRQAAKYFAGETNW